MSWTDQTKSMKDHGCTMGGVYSSAGDTWAQVGMDDVSKQEVEEIAKNIKSGKMEMKVGGKKCVVMGIQPGHSITGKIKADEDCEKPLVHAILGKGNCLYMAGIAGANERHVVQILETKFQHLKEY